MENAAGLEGAWQPRLQCVWEWVGHPTERPAGWKRRCWAAALGMSRAWGMR